MFLSGNHCPLTAKRRSRLDTNSNKRGMGKFVNALHLRWGEGRAISLQGNSEIKCQCDLSGEQRAKQQRTGLKSLVITRVIRALCTENLGSSASWYTSLQRSCQRPSEGTAHTYTHTGNGGRECYLGVLKS